MKYHHLPTDIINEFYLSADINTLIDYCRINTYGYHYAINHPFG